MKRKVFIFCLILCVLFLNSYTAFANDKSEGIVYNINIYVNGDLKKTHTQTLYEEGETPNSYNYGEFVKDKSNATINGKSALLLYHDSNFEVFNRSTLQYPVAGDETIVNLYYQVEEEEEPEELIYGTATLNISDGSSPIEGYSVTFNGKKGYKEDSVTGISNSEGKVIIKLDESYEWEYSVDGSTWDVNFENHAYRNDISLQKELEPKEIEYDGQDYDVNVKLQFNEKAGGTLTDGLTDSTDIIEKNFTKASGTAITYQEIIEELEEQDELIIHNDKLYRSSSIYVSAKDSVYSENTLVHHGKYVVTNCDTNIVIQFIYEKNVEVEPVSGGDEPGEPDNPIIDDPDNPEEPTGSSDTPDKPDKPKKTSKPQKVKQEPVTLIPDEPAVVIEYLAAEEKTVEQEPEKTIETIKPTDPPLSAPAGKWALINLIAMLITIILALALITTLIYNKLNEDEEEEVKHKTPLRILSIIIAIAAFVIFVLTENILLPMVLVDKYTLLMIIILIVQIIITISSKHKVEEENEYE